MAVYKVELSRDLLSLGVSLVGDVKTCSILIFIFLT